MKRVAFRVMGTAPDDRQDSLVPTPDEIVAASVATFLGQGLGLEAALATVIAISERAINYAALAGVTEVPWLAEIGENARRRLDSLDPSTDDHTGEEHADGSSSRSGRPA